MKRGFALFGLATALVLAVMAAAPPAMAQGARFSEFPNTFPKKGDMAPDFTLKTIDGEVFNLSEAVAKQPVVIEFGSYT
jgi:hypothetical protein